MLLPIHNHEQSKGKFNRLSHLTLNKKILPQYRVVSNTVNDIKFGRDSLKRNSISSGIVTMFYKFNIRFVYFILSELEQSPVLMYFFKIVKGKKYIYFLDLTDDTDAVLRKTLIHYLLQDLSLHDVYLDKSNY